MILPPRDGFPYWTFSPSGSFGILDGVGAYKQWRIGSQV